MTGALFLLENQRQTPTLVFERTIIEGFFATKGVKSCYVCFSSSSRLVIMMPMSARVTVLRWETYGSPAMNLFLPNTQKLGSLPALDESDGEQHIGLT